MLLFSIIAVILALVGALLLTVGMREAHTIMRLRSSGARAEGTVIGRYSAVGGVTPRFSFTTADGTEIVTQHEMAAALGPIRKGVTVRVAYDPTAPETARILSPYYATTNILGFSLFLFVGTIFLAIAAFFAFGVLV